MTPLNLLNGPRVRLCSLSAADAGAVARWSEDMEYTRLLSAEPAYPRSEAHWAEWIREGARGKDNFLFGIRLLHTDALIGWIELGDVQWTHRNAWLAVAIGERAYWDQGYGGEAVGLALDFAFSELNLHRVQLTVFSYNQRAIRLYEKLGFTREGAQREFLLRDGQRHDMLIYGILSHEWLER